MPSYIELDKNASVPASSDVSKLILSLNTTGQLVLTNSSGVSFYPTYSLSVPTNSNIDLSAGEYTITGSGIYEITTAIDSQLIFPDPISFEGETVTVINADPSNSISVQNNSYQPFSVGTSSQISNIEQQSQTQFVSINGKWRGGSYNQLP
jgi:hypothetical protein